MYFFDLYKSSYINQLNGIGLNVVVCSSFLIESIHHVFIVIQHNSHTKTIYHPVSDIYDT